MSFSLMEVSPHLLCALETVYAQIEYHQSVISCAVYTVKIKALTNQQQTNLADLKYLNFNSLVKLLKNF